MLDLNNQMLDFNKQMVAVNKQMYKLTAESFDDNATVKVVTLVTLTYLPASFIAVSNPRAIFANIWNKKRRGTLTHRPTDRASSE